jgi:hypothetical protein
MIVDVNNAKLGDTKMSKYYIKCGTLEIIYSTSKKPIDAAIDAIWETNENDVLDEHMYLDERGYRDYASADKQTMVYKSKNVLTQAGWNLEK